jgi:hypothetical protein
MLVFGVGCGSPGWIMNPAFYLSASRLLHWRKFFFDIFLPQHEKKELNPKQELVIMQNFTTSAWLH